MPVTVMPAAEVIAKYHDLWHVEKSFRMSKSDLDARPMFNRVRDAIEAPDHRLRRSGHLSRHPVEGRHIDRQDRQGPATTALSDHHHQRSHPNFPAAIPDHERKILTDLGFAGVLSQMSKLRTNAKSRRMPCATSPLINPHGNDIVMCEDSSRTTPGNGKAAP